ncbi:MFS transporter [Kitasatospora sp. NPDC051170]|uniref:MFS transporter n=1 Tax=Kitasatospora sp. NPDC051170 TaxID=3364056 RepID=UPI0037B8C1EE
MQAPRWLPAAAAVAVAAWGANQFTALATVYRARTDWSALALAAMFSVYLLGLAPGLLLAGPAADRFGRRRTVRAGLALSAAASLLLATGQEPAGYVSRLATGFAAGLVFLAGATWMRELSTAPAQVSSRRAMYATGTGFAAGALASGVLAEWLPDPMTVPALAHAAACLLVLRATREVPDTAAVRPPPDSHVEAHRAAVTHPRFRYVVLPAAPAVLGAATVAYVVLPPLVADRTPGYAPLFGGLVAALTLTAGVVAQPFAARLDDAHSARATLGAMAVVIAGLLVGALAAARDSVALVVVAAVVLGTGYGLTLGAGLHEVERLHGGPSSASLYQTTVSGGFLTPLLLTGTADHASYPALLVAMAVIGLLCLGVTAAHSRRHLPDLPNPPDPPKREDARVQATPTTRSHHRWAE